MPNIGLLACGFPPLSGGISHHLYNVCHSLPTSSIRVIGLPTPGWRTFDRQQTFIIHRLALPPRLGNDPRIFKALAPFYLLALLRISRQVDLFLCGQAHHTLLLPAYLASRLTGKPYGAFVYGLDILKPQQSWYAGLFNFLLQGASVVLADSQRAACEAVRLGVSPSCVHVINPIVDEERFLTQVDAEPVRRRHQLCDKQVILSVGYLTERKGHDIVLQALPEIILHLPDVHYLIVGRGPSEPLLHEIVARLGLEEKVTFAGFIPDEELPAYYAACDVFVMVSREIPEKGDIEGFGIVYLEANGLGKPVVGGRSGGVADAVQDGVSGLLIDPLSPGETARAIVRLLKDGNLARQLGQQGKERVIKRFTRQTLGENLGSVLEGVC